MLPYSIVITGSIFDKIPSGFGPVAERACLQVCLLIVVCESIKNRLASFSSFLSCSSPEMLDACRNREGWGPISRFRNFDFTLCFEEGVLLSTFLVLFGLAASVRCYALIGLPDLERTRRSLRILALKQVCSMLLELCCILLN